MRRVGSAAYLGALRRTAAGPFTVSDALSLDAVRAAAADGPTALGALLRPIDTGLDRFPTIDLTPAEVAAVARGQFVKPTAGFPAGADRYRLRAPDGALVAIAIAAGGGRLAPDKVLITVGDAVAVGAAPDGGRRRGRWRCDPSTARSSRSSASSTACTAATSTCSTTSCARRRTRGASDRHHLRPPSRRGPDRLGAAAAAPPRRAPRAPGRGRCRGDGRPAFRRGRPAHDLRRLRRDDPARDHAGRAAHDPRCRLRLRATGYARRRSPRSAPRGLRRRRRAARSSSTGAPSAAPTSARRSPRGDLAAARGCWADPCPCAARDRTGP